MKSFVFVLAILVALRLGAGQDGGNGRETRSAKCVIANGPAEGFIVFTETEGSATISIKGIVTGLNGTDSLHGFHIHAEPVTDGDCATATGHYNPRSVTHGGPTDEVRHNGDLGNIESDEFGVAIVDIEDPLVTLFGGESVMSRSVVVHLGRDDLGLGQNEGSLTTGNAGPRIGCCTIEEIGSE